jgi:sRNA-binding protein
MEKPNGTVFKAKITPGEVREAQAQDEKKVAPKLGEKTFEPKHPKRAKPENDAGELGEENAKEKAKEKPKPKKEKVKKETKPKKEKAPKEPKIATFPRASFVNKYHFMRVGPDVLKALGWEITGARFAVELDLKDGELIVRTPSK